MSKVIADISISLDGFATASHVTSEEPMGKDGERLHAWAFGASDARNQEALNNAVGGVGAIIAGRRTYDLSAPWWGADGPSGSTRIPVIALTHHTPDDVPKNSVYTFVGTGIDQALHEARTAAGAADVPVLLGNGTRLFDDHGDAHVGLETVDVTSTPEATHLHLRVLNGQP